MTKEELAEMLNGREYREEMTDIEEKIAKGSGLLVLFGASDDLVELRGVIYDEVGAYDGTTIFIDRKTGKLLLPIDDDDEEVLERYGLLETARIQRLDAIQIEAKWCSDDVYSWTFETSTPFASFDILEDESPYCLGIVIDLK